LEQGSNSTGTAFQITWNNTRENLYCFKRPENGVSLLFFGRQVNEFTSCQGYFFKPTLYCRLNAKACFGQGKKKLGLANGIPFANPSVM